MKNVYLQQVMEEKAEVERDLKKKRHVGPAAMAQRRDEGRVLAPYGDGEEAVAPAVDVRITGFWRWKNVIVPPNAYVIHTRRGHQTPLHIGMGISFRFDPVRDSFLVVPAAMQTIVISANCICRERQGILVQGYVQWIIDDFELAFRRLDFGDLADPMRVVNVQLREQVEAAIKDTVATMGIDDVLADKQPIIEELTARLRRVAEGEKQDEGLGLKIVTVQIKEAVVSSARLWESLQRPFRAERSKTARLAELTHESEVRRRESEEEQKAAILRIETEAEIASRKAAAEAEVFNRQQAEKARRAKLEAELLAEVAEAERSSLQTQRELDLLRIRAQVELEGVRLGAQNEQAVRQIELDGARRKVDNEVSPERVQQQMIDALPRIVERMPQPQELKAISVAGLDVPALVSSLQNAVDRFATGKGSK
jgi:hypothetical protein